MCHIDNESLITIMMLPSAAIRTVRSEQNTLYTITRIITVKHSDKYPPWNSHPIYSISSRNPQSQCISGIPMQSRMQESKKSRSSILLFIKPPRQLNLEISPRFMQPLSRSVLDLVKKLNQKNANLVFDRVFMYL